MQDVFFSMKRAFQGSLSVARVLLKPFGLTPARFDMMRALAQVDYGMMQSDLRRQLGVSAPTVSRMLRSLEELGLVWRKPARFFKQQKRVYLTERGSAVVLRAIVELGEPIALVVRSVVTTAWFSTETVRREIATFTAWLHRIRDGLRERARLDRSPRLSGLRWRWVRQVKTRPRKLSAALSSAD
jgi:DNA-binding MarR family transcriptional regulator